MLRPILDAATDWPVPADWAERYRSHFAERAAERGITSIPGPLLCWLVKEAMRRGRTDLVEHVFDPRDDTQAMRILLPEGCFYPLVRNGRLVTIYTQDQMRRLRGARRARKRNLGRRWRSSEAVGLCEW